MSAGARLATWWCAVRTPQAKTRRKIIRKARQFGCTSELPAHWRRDGTTRWLPDEAWASAVDDSLPPGDAVVSGRRFPIATAEEIGRARRFL